VPGYQRDEPREQSKAREVEQRAQPDRQMKVQGIDPNVGALEESEGEL
jgi:hypothetical protein